MVYSYFTMKWVMSFIIFLFVMIQLYLNQECHIYHCTFIEIPMFINLSNYLTQKNEMKLIKLCRFIKTIIERVSSPG